MKFRRGDVVIALFPNADGSPPKPRPVVVVQADVYNSKIQNVVVAAITTNVKFASDPASLLIDVTTPEGKSTGLVKSSIVSCINLATIDELLVSKKIGALPGSVMTQVDNCLKVALDL